MPLFERKTVAIIIRRIRVKDRFKVNYVVVLYLLLVIVFSLPVYVENLDLPLYLHAAWSSLAFSLFGIIMMAGFSLSVIKLITPFFVAIVLWPVFVISINKKILKSNIFIIFSLINFLFFGVIGYYTFYLSWGA